jgi:NAD(P)H-nitrite reductase large subunit
MATELVCMCMGVTKEEIEEAVKEKGCATAEDIQDKTYAGTSCGNCLPRIDQIVKKAK